MLFLSSLDNLIQDAYTIFQKVLVYFFLIFFFYFLIFFFLIEYKTC